MTEMRGRDQSKYMSSNLANPISLNVHAISYCLYAVLSTWTTTLKLNHKQNVCLKFISNWRILVDGTNRTSIDPVLPKRLMDKVRIGACCCSGFCPFTSRYSVQQSPSPERFKIETIYWSSMLMRRCQYLQYCTDWLHDDDMLIKRTRD